jgi:acetoin utilization deacetylase AcuC-like enzyme
MLPFKLVYSDDYYLPIGSHVFPAEKYKRIHDRLLASGIAAPSDFVVPSPATDRDVLLVHTPQYVEKLKTGTLSAREQLELEVPYSPELVRAFWLNAGGSILAADHALNDGMAISIGGGFHHAFPDHGEGFCLIHDVAIAIRRMQRDGKIHRAITVDCDVHQGNGTAAIFAGARTASGPLPPVPNAPMNPAFSGNIPAKAAAKTRMHSGHAGDVFTISLHQENNYPRGNLRLRLTSIFPTKLATMTISPGSTTRSAPACASSTRSCSVTLPEPIPIAKTSSAASRSPSAD